MSELAFNINGEAFEVPANASGWRVRKMRSKGSPEVVYAREGQPLVLPISAEISDLREEVDTTGRYRLDLVDQNNKPIEGAPSGYVQINFDVDTQHVATEAPSAARVALSVPTDNLALEAMRMQSLIACSVVDRFPQMMEAAATLLRAADGAGLPAREPRAVEEADDDEDDGDDGTPAAKPFDLNAIVAQVVPLIMGAMSSGKLKLPGVAEMLDWRKAATGATSPGPSSADVLSPLQQARRVMAGAGHSSTVSQSDVVPPNATAVLPPIGPETMAHFIAIQSALKPEEAALAREVAGNLSAPELHAWFDELKKLSVPQAVQKIRVLIAGNTEAVS